MSSSVDHPEHYNGRYECIEVMEEIVPAEYVKGFCLCNAFKYLWRCMKKHTDEEEDIRKAIWYLNRYLKEKGSEEENTIKEEVPFK